MESLILWMHRSSGRPARTLLFAACVLLSACAPRATPTLFLPPTAGLPFPSPALPAALPSGTPTATHAPTATAAASPTPCTNNLQFVQDMTVPDGATFAPGTPVDKQWLVTNSGTCDWGPAYRLKLTSGDALGAPTEQALYPARAGTQATLRMVFTAPQEAGTYQNAWQAFAPDGTAFGEAIYMQINVSP